MTNAAMMDAAIKAATTINNQTDQWRFIAALLVLGAFAVAVMLYLVKENKAINAAIEARDKQYTANLERMNTAQNETVKTLIAALERNTLAFNETNKLLDRIRFQS